MPTAPEVIPGMVERRGGREIHRLDDAGDSPAVVLLGGCGVPFYQWDAVAALLRGIAVCRLDRPGLVGTPWPGVLPRLSDEVDTLVDLISSLPAPVVVVAHSVAGLHAEALARLHPRLVRGLVLVDSSVEWTAQRPLGEGAWLTAARLVRASMALPRTRLLGSLADRVMVASQSRLRLRAASSPLARTVYRSRDATASVIAENGAYTRQVQDLARVRTAAPMPDIDVVVLTAAGDGGPQWVADQHRLAALLAARQVVVDDSRHLMMVDRPDVVSDAVHAVRSSRHHQKNEGSDV